MAVELTKVALWIETVEPGKPLGFLDASILCGDSLLGVFDLEVLRDGIPDAAYKPLSGDDKDAAKYFDRRNKAERDGQGTLDFSGGKGALPAAPPLAASLRAVRSLPEDSTTEIAEKKRRLAAAKSDRQLWSWRIAADLYISAFLLPKKDAPSDAGSSLVPTTDHVWRTLSGGQVYGPLVGAVREVTDKARVFHWPLEFPDVMAMGGFHVVIGNPPWERIKLQEQEFFASREPEIATAPTQSARGRLIAALKVAPDGSREHRLYYEFELAKRLAEASSIFAREGGRFPLTGRGDVNTYALFAEAFSALGKQAGILVPTGIATDATNASFFADLVDRHRLVRLLDFENREGLFPAVDSRMKFSILTTGLGTSPEFAFFLTSSSQLSDSRRRFTLDAEAIARINPNTKTTPIFRSRLDAELTDRIYSRVPVLIRDADNASNPWAISFHTRIWHMAEDSEQFRTSPDPGCVPLFEAKMLHQYDHRWCTYHGEETRELTVGEKADPNFEPNPRYWVPSSEVKERLQTADWNRRWLLGWRDITNATNERTVILLAFPRFHAVARSACLLANLSSIVLDSAQGKSRRDAFEAECL
jgi:hypothetical protein